MQGIGVQKVGKSLSGHFFHLKGNQMIMLNAQ